MDGFCSRRDFLERVGGMAAGSALAGASGRVAAGEAGGLLAGAARSKITPPLFVPYLTSSGNGTSAAFEGVHDDLFARALVLDDGHASLALLAVDSIGYDNTILGPGRHFTEELRRRVADRTGLQAPAILLAGTHAHSTPETIGLTPFRDVAGVPEWIAHHLEVLADTLVTAWRRREPVRVYHGKAQVTGVARNRRIILGTGKMSRHGPVPPTEELARPWRIDEELSVLGFERRDSRGGLVAVHLNYTAHPVVAMLLPQVCADFPGVASSWVEEQHPGSVCLFTNGAAGDVNSVAVSTNFEDVGRLGRRVGEAAVAKLAALRSEPALMDSTLGVRSQTLRLSPRDCPSLAEALQGAPLDARSPAGTRTRLAAKLAQGPLDAEIQVMRLGSLRWVALPGEVFVETGLALKAAGATFVVGYANGYLGYFPLRRSYEEGGYEVVEGAWSRVAPGCAEQLERAATALLS